MEHAGFLRRLIAYILDVLPITLAVAAVHWAFLGFDETWQRYMNTGVRDHEARAAFLSQRNDIRNTSLAFYLVYSSVLEATALRGTLGKWIVGIAVADRQGRPLGFGTAAMRNFSKPLSFLPCGLGCLWVAFTSEKRAWHDLIAGTVVVFRDDCETGV